VRRRRALQILGSAAAAPALLHGGVGELMAFGHRVRRGLASDERRSLAALTPLQARTVIALAEVIVPETETPGATEASVVDFVDVIVAEWLDPDEGDRFLQGADDVDRRARGREGVEFAACSPESRISLVAALDAEVEAARRDPTADPSLLFFHQMKRLTLAGYFTSEVGMRALGYRIVPGAFEACVLLDEYGAGTGR
jgi:gluconate 2-dehydrogenase gamma chain